MSKRPRQFLVECRDVHEDGHRVVISFALWAPTAAVATSFAQAAFESEGWMVTSVTPVADPLEAFDAIFRKHQGSDA